MARSPRGTYSVLRFFSLLRAPGCISLMWLKRKSLEAENTISAFITELSQQKSTSKGRSFLGESAPCPQQWEQRRRLQAGGRVMWMMAVGYHYLQSQPPACTALHLQHLFSSHWKLKAERTPVLVSMNCSQVLLLITPSSRTTIRAEL